MSLGRIQERMGRLKDWSLEIGIIIKEKQCKDFKEALWYVNKVGELAENAGHHPMILLNGGIVRVSLTSHEENGLTDKDFDLAEEIDRIE